LSTTRSDSLGHLVQQLLALLLVQPASESSRQLSLRDLLGSIEIDGVSRVRYGLGLCALGGCVLAYSVAYAGTVSLCRVSDDHAQLLVHHGRLDIRGELVETLGE